MNTTHTAATTTRMGFSQSFIASAFDPRYADEAKARIGDNRREWNARKAGR